MDDLQETSSVSRPQDARPTASQTGISMPGNSGTKPLEEQANEIQQETTLLRASQAPANPDTLLRPVQAAPDTTPTEQLLRPTTPE